MSHLSMSRLTAKPSVPLSNASAAFTVGRRLRDAMATTPGQLRLCLGGLWMLILLLSWTTSVGLERHRREMQTIGRDSAPSIIAAQSIKANIAALHGNVMRQFLASPVQARDAGGAYRALREKITDGLLKAAENITYGNDERGPIRDLLNGLAKYDDAIARATALHEQNTGDWLAAIHDATAILDHTLCPSADQLDNANQKAMDTGYTDDQANAGWSTVMVIVACLLLTGGCAAVQLLIQRRMHRRISLPLAGLMLFSLVWTVYSVGAMRDETADLKTAKSDAFDSIGVMWRARANAFDAQSHLALSLLDPSSAREATQTFESDSSTLAAFSDGNSFTSIQSTLDDGKKLPSGFDGFIARELNNITFVGEREAATDMYRRYVRYIGIARAVRDAGRAGNHTAAVELCLGESNDQAAGAMSSFDSALGKVLEINQTEFDHAVDRGFADVAGLWVWNWAVALITAILAYWAMSQRLAEYD